MTRVWNITNDPSTDVPAQNLVVLGKLLKPGQSMQVDEARLKYAHKTKKDIEAKLLAVGKAPPSYLATAVMAKLPEGMARSSISGAIPALVSDLKPKAPAIVEEPKKNESKEELKKEEAKWGGKKR